MTCRANIRRALTTPCTADILGLFTRSPKNGVARTSWMRLQNLMSILRAGESFSVKQLSKAADCHPKTIHRDLAFIRRQGVKLVFDHTHNINMFRLDKSFPIPPQFNFSAR